LEEYERDFEKFGKNPPSHFESRAIVQDLSHQVAQLSSLEFDEGKRNELLGLPQTIQSMKKVVEGESKGMREEMDRKVGEIVGEKDRLIEELRREKDEMKDELRNEKYEMKREMEEIDKQREEAHQLKDKQREESHQQMIQDLTEENKRITKEFREMRDLMNQDFKEMFDDMKVGMEYQVKTIQDLRNQLESLSTLTNNDKNEERSEEDVRGEIDQIISEITLLLPQLTRDQRKRFTKIQDELEDEEEELSNEELLEMLDELNQMKLSI